MSFVISSQTTTPDSLRSTLQKTASGRTRLGVLTSLTDISRNDDILVNTKQLYQEALKANDNHYKEAALTEILQHYTNTDQTDSANAYIAKAEQELKGETRTSLVSFMRTVQDTCVIFYTSDGPRRKALMSYLSKLEGSDKLSLYERIAYNHALGMAVSNSIMEKDMLKEGFKQGREYSDNVLTMTEKLPIRYTYNFPLNTYPMLRAYASNSQERGQYATHYLNTILGHSSIPKTRKRPHVIGKRHLLNAYSNLAISAEVIGKDLATSYYHEFMNLLEAYPESTSIIPGYELCYISANCYLGTKDYKRFIEFSDSLINLSRQIPPCKEHVIAYVSARAAAYDSLRIYKEAHGTSKEYAVLLDTLCMQELRKKMENLETEKRANELVVGKKSLELKLQRSKKENYLYVSLLLLVLCTVFYIFLRLGKMRSLHQASQKSNEQVLITNQKARESEEAKTAFTRDMSHEVRTPLNAISGFSEFITNDDIPMGGKQAFSRIICENCCHLAPVLNNLLEIAQFSNGSDSLPLVPTRIHELCLHRMQQVKKYQEEPEVNYVVEGDKENDVTLINHVYFSLITSHLLTNANRSTEEGSITPSYHPDSGAGLMTLLVTDTGCGIPQDKQEQILERFMKTNDLVPDPGLGLYLRHLIVNRLDGRVEADPSYTRGSRFVITIPIATSSKPSKPTD